MKPEHPSPMPPALFITDLFAGNQASTCSTLFAPSSYLPSQTSGRLGPPGVARGHRRIRR